jgi:hypothetical protein
MSAHGVLEVEFVPGERTTHSVRLAVHNLVLLGSDNRALAGRMTVTCAELVEALAKRLAAGGKVRLRLSLDASAARVEVSCDLADEGAQIVERALRSANQDQPMEAYTHALTREEAEGQLGLARVRYEGQMALSAKRSGRQFALVAQSTTQS